MVVLLPPPDALLPVADAVVGADSCEPRFAGAFMTYGPVPSEAAYQRSTVGGGLGGLLSLLPSAVSLRCGLFAFCKRRVATGTRRSLGHAKSGEPVSDAREARVYVDVAAGLVRKRSADFRPYSDDISLFSSALAPEVPETPSTSLVAILIHKFES